MARQHRELQAQRLGATITRHHCQRPIVGRDKNTGIRRQIRRTTRRGGPGQHDPELSAACARIGSRHACVRRQAGQPPPRSRRRAAAGSRRQDGAASTVSRVRVASTPAGRRPGRGADARSTVSAPVSSPESRTTRRRTVRAGVITHSRISAVPGSPSPCTYWGPCCLRSRPRPPRSVRRQRPDLPHVEDRTGNQTAADAADIIVGVPLAMLGLFLLLLVVRVGPAPPGRPARAPAPRPARSPRPGRSRWSMGHAQRAPSVWTPRRGQRPPAGCSAPGRWARAEEHHHRRRVHRRRTMFLSELGFDIAPLIASAGIVGVALGFGAQSLVKDFLSGIFMIFEDQYGVGDVVDLGEAIGTVEAVSLRVTRLRDINGTVWYVRNGEIMRVGNMSQNWARTVLDVGVAYGEDLARSSRCWPRSRTTCGRTRTSAAVIEEPVVWGVQELAADAVTVRVALKTAPLEQWAVAREMRERIKARFDHEGIEIPFPQRVVWQRDQPVPDASRRRTRADARPDRRRHRWTRDHLLRRDRRRWTRSATIVRRSTRAWPRTRCCARSTPRRTSDRPRSASRCSSCSTGAARRRTPTRAATRGCGCGTRRSRSRRRQGALAAALPRRPRRRRPHPRAGRAVLGLRHPRGPVHGQHSWTSQPADAGHSARLARSRLRRRSDRSLAVEGDQHDPRAREHHVAVADLGVEIDRACCRRARPRSTGRRARAEQDRHLVVDVGLGDHERSPIESVAGLHRVGQAARRAATSARSGPPGSTRSTSRC